MEITSKLQLKIGDKVKVLFTDHITKRAIFPSDELPKEYDNGQIGKPERRQTEVIATVVKTRRGLGLKVPGYDYISDDLKNFKKTNKVSASWGGTPYKNVWYYTSAVVISKETA